MSKEKKTNSTKKLTKKKLLVKKSAKKTVVKKTTKKLIKKKPLVKKVAKKIVPKKTITKKRITKKLTPKKRTTKKRVIINTTNTELKKDPRYITTINRINSFLALNSLKRVAIIADNDQDGISAAVNLKLFFNSKKIESKVFFYNHNNKSFNSPKEELINFNPEKTVFLDLSENLVSVILKELGTILGPSLLIDHHQQSLITNSPFRVVVVKPHSFSKIEPSKYPTSKMVFDLFGGKDWVCAIGVIGDFAFEEWASFLELVSKKYSVSKKELFELDAIVGSVLAQYPEKIGSLFKFLCTQRKPEGLLKSDYVVFKNLFESKLKLLIELFYKEAEYYSDVDLYFFKADNNFSGKLSTVISQHLPNQVVIIYEESNEKIKCSIRRQDFRVNCGELAKTTVSGLKNSSGGGHTPAAGASFLVKDFEEFKKRVRLYLLNNPPKKV